MSRWVTFYEDIRYGISYLRIHKNREEATDCFKMLSEKFFRVRPHDMDNVKLPIRFGLPFRYVVGMSYPMFKKRSVKRIKESE